MFRKILLLLTAIFVMASAACAPAEPKATYSTEQVCNNIYLFTTSVDTLKVASNFADPKALQAQFNVVRRNFNNLVQSAANLNQAEKQDLQTAAEALMNTAGSLPADTSVSDALKQLAEPIKNVRAAADNLKTSLKCP